MLLAIRSRDTEDRTLHKFIAIDPVETPFLCHHLLLGTTSRTAQTSREFPAVYCGKFESLDPTKLCVCPCSAVVHNTAVNR
jgi:hypothetical protein